MSQNNNNSQTQHQHTNPLLWNRGAYIFGNHDQTSILNEQKSNTNNNSNNNDPNVSVTKRKVCDWLFIPYIYFNYYSICVY